MPEYATDSLDAIRTWMALLVGSVHSLWQLTLCDSGVLGQHWSVTQFITVSMVIFLFNSGALGQLTLFNAVHISRGELRERRA